MKFYREQVRIFTIRLNSWLGMGLACVVLTVAADICAAQVPPVPDSPIHAQLSFGFNLRKRCPDMQVADTDDTAVVVFWLLRSGAPSRVAIRASSGSDALDAAATSCVAKLRFPPATTLGDGQPIDSWQQISLAWAKPERGETRAASPRATGDPKQDDAGGQTEGVIVRVCVDDTGTLKQQPTIVHSSGKASLDQAAVKIAASGAAYYRPDTPASGAMASGCAQLTIRFDVK